MEHLLFAPNILGARKDMKRGSKFSVGEKFWPCEWGWGRHSDIPFWKSSLKLPRHLPGQTSLIVVGRREGLCKPEVPMQEQLKACLPPLQWNNRENSKYLLQFALHPRKQRTWRGPDGVLHLFPGSLILSFGYSLDSYTLFPETTPVSTE